MVKKTGCYIIICVIVVMSLMVYPLFAQQKRTTTIKATYYHDRFNNRKTSSGEKFFQKLYTAAHKTLPFNTIVKITNPKTSRSVLVKINDRCRRAGIVDLYVIVVAARKYLCYVWFCGNAKRDANKVLGFFIQYNCKFADIFH